MPTEADENWRLDEGLDPDGPSAEDLERFGSETDACPECGSEVYDQAELCHVCGHAIERGPGSIPTWVGVAAAVGVLGLLLVVLG